MRNDLMRYAAYAGCAASIIMFLAAGGIAPLRLGTAWISKEAQAAAIFFVQSISAAQIQNSYRGVQVSAPLTETTSTTTPAQKVRILVVPGHQPDAGGTVFNGLLERTVVADIADALATLLKQNPHYAVMVARTKTAWHPVLQSYFDTHALEIETFQQSQALQMAQYIADGRFILEDDQVYHNGAPRPAALQLYGINKWASDNKYDITLHLHINDETEHRAGVPGDYNGFTLYVPDRQYSNAAASRAIGEALAARLNAYHATSTLPKEDRGIVEDRQLIAVGSNNSVDSAAVLIEYGYIYEPQFREPAVRSVAIADYAFQTYLGLQDFFKDPLSPTYGSVSFPYDWTKVTGKKKEKGPGVYALQAALRFLGYYPPSGKSFSDCPISGVAGNCTRAAIMEYQRAQGLAQTGTLGPQTRAALARDTARPPGVE